MAAKKEQNTFTAPIIDPVEAVMQATRPTVKKKEKAETKSKRFNCLLYPSLYEKLVVMSKLTEQSVNDIINDLVADYVELYAESIAEQEELAKSQALAEAKQTIKAAKKGGN